MKAPIFKIERLNTHNGPGFRTVIYFKGCPLHCTWCHNPEGINSKPEVWFNASKCISCKICIESCTENALSFTHNGIEIARNKCNGCQLCASVCPSKAMEKIGEYCSVDDLMETILQDKILFESSGGGITVTGGEPGNHPEFVTELFKACQRANIHTAFDTSGAIKCDKLNDLIKYTDTIFLDIKLLNNKNLKLQTGLNLTQLYKTVNWLKEQKQLHPNINIEFRTPLIPEVTDTTNNLNQIANYLTTEFSGANWELCKFNNLCADKYQKMNMHWKFSGKKHSSELDNILESIKETFLKLNISISGFDS